MANLNNLQNGEFVRLDGRLATVSRVDLNDNLALFSFFSDSTEVWLEFAENSVTSCETGEEVEFIAQ